MRLHIELDDKLVTQVDELSGNEGRAGFIRSAIESAVREALRWRDIEASAGMIETKIMAGPRTLRRGCESNAVLRILPRIRSRIRRFSSSADIKCSRDRYPRTIGQMKIGRCIEHRKIGPVSNDQSADIGTSKRLR